MKLNRATASEMIRDGFKAMLVFDKNQYPVQSINVAFDNLADNHRIFSEYTELTAKTVVIYDNVWNVERYRFNKTKEGRYEQVRTK